MKRSRAYTIALGALAAFHFLVVGSLLFSAERSESWFTFMGKLHLLFGIACLVGACARWLAGRHARPVTSAVTILLILDIPFGTAMFFWWLVSIRERERSDDGMDTKRIEGYAAALYLFAFVLLDGALVMDWLTSLEGGDELFESVGLGLALAAPFIFLGAALQGIRKPWALTTSRVFHVILVLWFPLGTILAYFWYSEVGPRQRRLMRGSQPEHDHVGV